MPHPSERESLFAGYADEAAGLITRKQKLSRYAIAGCSSPWCRQLPDEIAVEPAVLQDFPSRFGTSRLGTAVHLQHSKDVLMHVDLPTNTEPGLIF